MIIKKDNFKLILKNAEKALKEYLIKLKERDQHKFYVIFKVLEMSKYLKASNKYHGAYKGGLFDHLKLVFYLCYKIYNLITPEEFSLEDLCDIALLHDMEKINNSINEIPPNLREKFLFIDENNENSANKLILNVLNSMEYGHYGSSHHVDRTFAMLSKADIELNDNQVFGLVYHHGGWSNYKLRKSPASNSFSGLLHACDMIASKTMNI
ncbi:MAG: hypothetical protein KGD63_11520 [Candidatus Lokiarchaeota archaeon]|nr:hypothetical protein [Candidatus Lokiarchaeota archaeon]